jgi:cell pole-organizing protein PopZ
MEEILASIRRIIADDQDSGRPIAADMPPSPQRPAPAADDMTELEAARGRDLELAQDDAEESDDFVENAQDRSREVGADPAEVRRPTAPSLQPPKAKSLLSETAQASAATAFQRLSTTVRASHPQTLEGVVIEMLRPMLKAWLDESLPPLVERLVQAEIERIVRGC